MLAYDYPLISLFLLICWWFFIFAIFFGVDDDADRDFIKLDPADVVTTEQAAKLLDPLIKPLPPFPTA